MLLRSPRTLLPYAVNMKEKKYHGLEGQYPKDQWKSTRAEWLSKMVEEWIQNLRDWQNAPYEPALYIVYEDLIDPIKGPKVMKRMAKVLKDNGVETIEDKDIQC